MNSTDNSMCCHTQRCRRVPDRAWDGLWIGHSPGVLISGLHDAESVVLFLYSAALKPQISHFGWSWAWATVICFSPGRKSDSIGFIEEYIGLPNGHPFLGMLRVTLMRHCFLPCPAGWNLARCKQWRLGYARRRPDSITHCLPGGPGRFPVGQCACMFTHPLLWGASLSCIVWLLLPLESMRRTYGLHIHYVLYFL